MSPLESWWVPSSTQISHDSYWCVCTSFSVCGVACLGSWRLPPRAVSPVKCPGTVEHHVHADADQSDPFGIAVQRENPDCFRFRKLSAVPVRLSQRAALWSVEQLGRTSVRPRHRWHHPVHPLLGHVLQWHGSTLRRAGFHQWRVDPVRPVFGTNEIIHLRPFEQHFYRCSDHGARPLVSHRHQSRRRAVDDVFRPGQY